jgi:hypothetical protein
LSLVCSNHGHFIGNIHRQGNDFLQNFGDSPKQKRERERGRELKAEMRDKNLVVLSETAFGGLKKNIFSFEGAHAVPVSPSIRFKAND